MPLQILLFLFLIFTLFSVSAEQKINGEDENKITNVTKIDNFLTLADEKIPHQVAINLATSVIQKRDLYSSTSLAKAYLLLANIANSRGDLTKAFQYAQDGLSLKITEPNIKLELLLKTAEGYYAKGRFLQVKHIAEEIITQSTSEDAIDFHLKALGYRAVIYALTVDYPKALTDLKEIDRILTQHQEFVDHIDLLEILAKAHYYLGDYETVIAIHLKLLNLRYHFSKNNDVGKSYYALATAYQQLNKLDDAYNAFWQAKNVAKQNNSPIKIAYTELGLGEILLAQGNSTKALEHLTQAERLFNNRNLSKPYLSTLLALAQVKLDLNEQEQAYTLLIQAKKLAHNVELTIEQTMLYKLLASMYFQKGQVTLAWEMLQTYIEHYQNFELQRTTYLSKQFEAEQDSQHNRQATLQLALKSEIQAQYAQKLNTVDQFNKTLLVIIALLLLLLILLILNNRSQNINESNLQFEAPLHILTNSVQTKQIYQQAYKQARKYQYPLAVAYISILNWGDLRFQYNKKEIREVKQTIAKLINEYIGDFDLAGMLNDGEYLLIFPHQEKLQVEKLVVALTEALRVRFFANLGEVIVNINFTLDTLSPQDIEPFIFLSHLTGSIKTD